MNICFDSKIAKEYGINIAVILDKLHFWIDYNKANNVNFYDGRYWTFNSMEAWSKQIDFMTINTIRRTLEKMEKEGLIVTGNYNTSKYDRTKWYALTDKANSFFENSQNHLAKMPNQNGKNTEPIPTNNTTNNTANNTANNTIPPPPPSGKFSSQNAEREKAKDIVEDFIEISIEDNFKPIIREWCAYKREKGQAYKLTGLKTCYAKLLKLSNNNPDTARQIIEQSMASNWAGIFALKNNFESKSSKPDEVGRMLKFDNDEEKEYYLKRLQQNILR